LRHISACNLHGHAPSRRPLRLQFAGHNPATDRPGRQFPSHHPTPPQPGRQVAETAGKGLKIRLVPLTVKKIKPQAYKG